MEDKAMSKFRYKGIEYPSADRIPYKVLEEAFKSHPQVEVVEPEPPYLVSLSSSDGADYAFVINTGVNLSFETTKKIQQAIEALMEYIMNPHYVGSLAYTAAHDGFNEKTAGAYQAVQKEAES